MKRYFGLGLMFFAAMMGIYAVVGATSKTPKARAAVDPTAIPMPPEVTEPGQVTGNDPAARQEFARLVEIAYLKNGVDVHMKAEGPKATTLYMRFALLGRPDVYQFENDGPLIKHLRAMGYTKATLTDGFDNTWHINVSEP